MDIINNDKKKLTIILTILAVIAVSIIVFIFAGAKGRKLKRCINLGQKYLTEMNYEEAIASFEKAIEIDPMSAEAYIGIADAYIGMARNYYADGDIDNANASLDEAKSTLENGIDVFTKYAENNTGSKSEEAKSNVEKLISKLEEVEKIRLSYMSMCNVKPFYECLNNVWGKNWMDWKFEDYVATYNLHDDGTNGGWSESTTTNSGECRHAYDLGEEIGLNHYYNYPYSETQTLVYDMESIYIYPEYISYRQGITNTVYDVSKDVLYTFCMENGINSIEGAKSYFGVPEIDVEQTIDIMTDMGPAKAILYKDDVYGETLSIGDFENDSHMQVIVAESGFKEMGITGIDVYVNQGI